MNTSTRFGGLVSESVVRSSVVEAKIRSNKAKFSIIISIVEIGDKPLASLSLLL